MSSSPSFNVLYDPWIPVGWRECACEPTESKIGIREALLRSNEIRCISHASPFIEFGLYRILITIVLDAYIMAGKRPTIGRMRQMLENRSFCTRVIDEYLEEHKSAFELLGEDRRFLQREPAKGRKPEAVIRMFAAIPSGSNIVHWHHESEDEIAVSYDVAAQFLTAVSPWNFKVKPDEPRTLAGDPPMYALVLGDSLFETLVLNLPRPSGRITLEQEMKNGPDWRTPLSLEKLPKVPTVAQGYTWPVRIIKLEADDGKIAKAINVAAYKKRTVNSEKANADKLNKGKRPDVLYSAEVGWRDPHAGTITSGSGVQHISARQGVPVWRDAIPLFLVSSEGEPMRGEKRRSRPEVVTNALRILEGKYLKVVVYGMRKKSGGGGDVKVEEWFRSVLCLPAEVARDERLSSLAIKAFEKAQKVADVTRTAIRMLRPKMDALPRQRLQLKELRRLEADRIQQFWQALEELLVYTYLEDLAAGNPRANEDLDNGLKVAARNAFRLAADPHRGSADGLFRIANASNYLELRLARLLPTGINK